MKPRIGISACLLGAECNFNGTDLLSIFLKAIADLDQVEFIPFCPEDAVFGTPRANLRIVGGDGNDVLEGLAQVINEQDLDVTEQQIRGAEQFLSKLQAHDIQIAILMDGSPSCGSHLLLAEENWPRGGFKRGEGVTTTLLRRNGIQVLSSFDERSIAQWIQSIGVEFNLHPGLKDLRDHPKFAKLFVSAQSPAN